MPPVGLPELLIQYGPIGVVLAWFMFRMEPEMKAVRRAIDRLTRAHLLDVVSRPGAAPAVRRLAKDLLSELNLAEKKPPLEDL
jgi:hypothetical protein